MTVSSEEPHVSMFKLNEPAGVVMSYQMSRGGEPIPSHADSPSFVA
jgi:hypothetical protein